jgi:hypothetical protein
MPSIPSSLPKPMVMLAKKTPQISRLELEANLSLRMALFQNLTCTPFSRLSTKLTKKKTLPN